MTRIKRAESSQRALQAVTAQPSDYRTPVTVLSCNRLCRPANPPGPSIALGDWWRRAAERVSRRRQAA
jgi:hypothetical protein